MPTELPHRYASPGALARPLLAVRAWVMVVVALTIYGLISIYAGAARRPARLADWCYQSFSKALMMGFGVRIAALELESLPEDWPRQLVMVSNHESNLDGPLILLCLADRHVRFVIKHELTRVPILGAALVDTGCIPVQRQVKGAGVRSLEGAVSDEVDVLFFAEGTRSKDGRLQPFRKGAFRFAQQHGWPILPIGIAGTGASLPPGGASPRPGPVTVVVGKPISSEGDVDSLKSLVEDEVARLRARARVRAAAALQS